ncbi:MAG: hypothetical protein GC147_10885 [Porphyrobacter sp.]|nr:hypothetical protein [Porphyrobacter sp.]
MTQQNAAMVEQSTAATRSLSSEAQRLGELVAQFRVGEAAAGAGAHALAAPAAPPRPAPPRKPAAPRRPVAAPVTGNLARKPQPLAAPGEDDWSEF